MGAQERQREDGYWSVFSETGTMPPIPDEFAQDDKLNYALGVLRSEYNPLTKVLFGEALARAGKLSEEDKKNVSEAIGWIRPMIFSAKRNYNNRQAMAEAFRKFCKEAVCEVFSDKKMKAEDGYQLAWECVRTAPDIYKTLPNSIKRIPILINSFRDVAKSPS